MPFRLRIPRRLYDQMVAQAFAALPNECCGLLAGRIMTTEPAVAAMPVVQALCCYPLVNAAGSPVEYLSDPRSMFDAVRDMRRQGTDILAVYHSHPTSDPVPSLKDLARNYSEDVVNLILSLKDGKPLMQAWWLTAEEFRPADWERVE